MVQPHESLTLNGIESKDDHEIVTYQWHQVSGNSSAVIEVSDDDWGHQGALVSHYWGVYLIIDFSLTVRVHEMDRSLSEHQRITINSISKVLPY